MSSDRPRYRSLYWRIALGSLGVLAFVLALEAAVFVFVATRAPQMLPPRALHRLAELLARDLEGELARNPRLDLERFLAERRDSLDRPVAIVGAEGRLAGDDIAAATLVAARARLRGERGMRLRHPPFGVAAVRLPQDGVRGVPPEARAAAIVVLGGRPLAAVVAELGPLMLGAGLVLAFGGTVIATRLVFGPAHRRLKALEAAAERLGAGDRQARTPEEGGDEIAAVSAAFNRMAAEINRRIDQVESSDRARRQLLADVSHELMTPLTAIRGYVETLRMPDLALPASARERHLGIVLEETLRLERIVGDLLDLARLDAIGLPLQMGEVRVAELIARLEARHGESARAKGVALTTRVAGGLETVRGDAGRLEQALQNLVANAVRHTPAGGEVRIAAERVNGRVRFEVRDTGQGIAAEHLPHVFDRFYRADASRTGASGGSGLGLAIVKAIAERHGGAVSVESAPGTETTFAMLLPDSP